ncbi:MAG: 50S ribosomal protein L22, partial [Deltaproteobacteria bacterium]|nr:50S ribosomal protein L22 [Deltaproteobacteria bacterium]
MAKEKREKDTVNIRAVGKFLRMPPDKVRIMARNVIGLQVQQALDLLRFSPNKSAALIYKVLHSASANASNNFEKNVDRMVVDKIFVDRGSMLKRYHPCAHGRAKPILKRTCHITVIINE